MKLLKNLITGLGMFIGLFVFYFIVSLGYYKVHIWFQRKSGVEKIDLDHGAAATFGQVLFSIWAITFVTAAHYFKEWDWYELHPHFTSNFTTACIWFVIIGVLLAAAPSEESY